MPDEAPDAPVDDDEVPRGTGAALYAFCLVVFLGLFVGPLGALFIWWRRKDEGFIDLHGRQALDLTLTALLGGVIYVVGRVIEPDFTTPARLLQWAGFGIIAAQAIQGVWALVDAARGGARPMLLSLRVLRRGGEWTRPMA